MMKTPLLFLAFFIAMLLTSCASTSVHNVICKAEDQIVTTTSAAVAAGLQCKNLAAIQADLRAVVEKVEMCTPVTPTSKKKISPFICGLVADLAVNQLGKVVKPEWQCTPTAASATVKTILISACSAIPGL